MTLQWLSAAAFLYTELGLGLLLCLGFISNARWQSIFTSRLLAIIKQYGNFYFSAFVLIMFVLFLDSVYNMHKYSRIDTNHMDLRNNPQAEVQAHMKLFRAQRNCYISGFSLFMLIVIRRLVMLISRQAQLEASHEAITKQAKGASEQAKKLMEDNEKLTRGQRAQAASDTDAEDEKNKLADQLKKVREELAESREMQASAEKNLQAMKMQSEGLHKEYDRLSEDHAQLTKKLSQWNNDATEEKKDL